VVQTLPEEETMTTVSDEIQSITPILIVEKIEPCLMFWERLGFHKIADVPHNNRLGFVMFTAGNQNLMLQTEESADADLLNVAPRRAGGAVYLGVSSIEAIEKTVDADLIVVAKRKTFYGATEIWVREPGGNLVGFAEHQK
jgi:hypothetical protein